MINDTAGQRLFNTAAQAYGPQGAADIFAEIAASVNYANVCLQPPTPINDIGVGIYAAGYKGPSDSYVVGVVSRQLGFDLLIKQEDLRFIIPEIRRTIVHEAAHITRDQHNETLDLYDPEDTSVFPDILDEGIAVQAEIEFLGESIHDSSQENTRMLTAGLREVLSMGDIDNEEYVALLVGNKEFLWKGYKVGHFVVASMVGKGYTMQDLVRTPNSEIRKFTENLV